MFNRKSKNREAEIEILTSLTERAEELRRSKDLEAIRHHIKDLTRVWPNASDGEAREAAWDALSALKRHANELVFGFFSAALPACPYCGGLEYLASDEVTIDEASWKNVSRPSPSFRLVVCRGCGKTEWFAADLQAIRKHTNFNMTIKIKKVRADGPYR